MRRSRIKRKERFLRKKIGMAIRDYNMIEKGDRICVAVSGGKDSMTLLRMLSSRTLKLSLGYSLMAACVETDYEKQINGRKELLKSIFSQWGVPYYCKKINISKNKEIDWPSGRRKDASCFWCSWIRRKAIFKIAEKFNCNKIAFGHNKDDIAETVLLNLLFHGEISTMNPSQEMFGGGITIIRPLSYIEEREILSYAREAGFLEEKKSCPNADNSKRKFVEDFIKEAVKISPAIKTNLFRAPSRIKEDYLGKVYKRNAEI